MIAQDATEQDRQAAQRISDEVKTLVRMKEIRELLAEFGLRLCGYDPGVTASLIDSPETAGRGYWGEAISFEHNEWKWLEPLLNELRQLRQQQEWMPIESGKCDLPQCPCPRHSPNFYVQRS